MKKRIFLAMCCLLAFAGLRAQVTCKGVMLVRVGELQKGDTVTVTGRNRDSGTGFTSYSIKGEARMVPGTSLKLLENNMSLWESAWFQYGSSRYAEKGPELNVRQQIKAWSDSELNELESEGRLLHDLELEDYLQRCLLRIHPAQLVKNQPTCEAHLSVWVHKDATVKLNTRYSGILYAGAQWVSAFTHEAELYKALAAGVALVEMDYPMLNVNSFSSPESVHAVTNEQKMAAEKIARQWMKTEADSASFLSGDAFTRKIRGAVLYTAYQHFYAQNFDQSLLQIDRLIKAEAASDEVWLLKAKIYRRMYDSEAANLTALSYLARAESIAAHNMAEIPAERGILLLRLGRPDEARTAFEAYRDILLLSGEASDELRWAQEMIWQCRKT
ncbi:MAG: hypothetical protein EAZ89_19050 [Bacteroidetes bacterium]|nr:MAG: hypothetical protein EAZ89_19050 [Bacteroidota bacterium]